MFGLTCKKKKNNIKWFYKSQECIRYYGESKNTTNTTNILMIFFVDIYSLQQNGSNLISTISFLVLYIKSVLFYVFILYQTDISKCAVKVYKKWKREIWKLHKVCIESKQQSKKYTWKNDVMRVKIII